MKALTDPDFFNLKPTEWNPSVSTKLVEPKENTNLKYFNVRSPKVNIDLNR
jgi:hypothetical protein